MTEQESQLDQIQREKVEMISSLTSRLSDLKGEVGEVGTLSNGFKVIQEELQKLKETVQGRNSIDFLDVSKFFGRTHIWAFCFQTFCSCSYLCSFQESNWGHFCEIF